MRKIISLGLVAIMLSIFSGQLLAGKIPVCEDIKNDPAYKGLYGLCNAYWNADNEVARAAILINYTEKAGPGGPGMPGLDDPEPEGMACPCWAGVVLEDVGLYTPPDICYLNTPSGDQVFFGEFGGDGQLYITNGVDCAHMASYYDESGTLVTRLSVSMEPLGEADQLACLTEMDDLVNLYFDNGLDCIVF